MPQTKLLVSLLVLLSLAGAGVLVWITALAFGVVLTFLQVAAIVMWLGIYVAIRFMLTEAKDDNNSSHPGNVRGNSRTR